MSTTTTTTRRPATFLGSLLVAGATVALAATPAFADHGISTTDTVNIRTGPGTSYNPIGTVPANTSPQYNCYTTGQSINGVDVWFNISYGGHTGFITSYYDNSHYTHDSDIPAKYGIPVCPTNQPPQTGVTAAQQTAVNWASARVGSSGYSGYCLSFVFDAYTAAGKNLRNQVSVPIGSNTYPVDIWGHFSAGRTGTGTPPEGALVFYAAKSGDRTNSHVTIATGNGTDTISTADGVATPIHHETISQHSYANYLGWWLPAS